MYGWTYIKMSKVKTPRNMIVEFKLSDEEYNVLKYTAQKLFENNKIKYNRVGELSLSKANEFLRMEAVNQ